MSSRAIMFGVATKRDFAGMEKRRMRAGRLLDKGFSQAEVARRVGASRQSVLRWQRAFEQGGVEALKSAGRAGRKPRLSPEQDRRLAEILTAGPEACGFPTPLWTLPRVARVIRQEFSVACHPTTALRILSQRLGWSCQKPVGRAIERDEDSIRRWKRKTWPAIKKKPAPKGAPSSSSTKAG
jgi:transposase